MNCLFSKPAVAAPSLGKLVMGLSPVYSYILLENKSQPKGGGSSLFLLYPIKSWLAVRLSGQWSGHSIEGTEKTPGGTLHVLNASIGLYYLFDLVRWSPAIEGAIGLLHQRLNQKTTSDVGLQLGVGLDYWLIQWFSVGAGFHYHAFLSNPTQYPVYFDAGPRIAIRWL